MTNKELLAYNGPEKLLVGIDRQRRFVLRIEGQPKPCPSCGTLMTAWQGRGFANVEDYDLMKVQNDFGECVGCQRAIRFALPMIGDWHWQCVIPAPETRHGH